MRQSFLPNFFEVSTVPRAILNMNLEPDHAAWLHAEMLRAENTQTDDEDLSPIVKYDPRPPTYEECLPELQAAHNEDRPVTWLATTGPHALEIEGVEAEAGRELERYGFRFDPNRNIWRLGPRRLFPAEFLGRIFMYQVGGPFQGLSKRWIWCGIDAKEKR